jgi:hypothetical protein
VNFRRFAAFDPMTEIDPLIRLLQTADAAADLPTAAGDLPDRVRRRRAKRARKSKQIQFASLAGAAVVLVGISINAVKPPAPPGGEVPVDQQLAINPPHPKGTRPGANAVQRDNIAELRAQTDALAAEAESLARELALTHGYEVRQHLREEHQTQLAAQFDRQLLPDSIDRAALVGLSQGDFYRDVRQSTDEARAAYESVVDHFPESQWAALAQTRINQLQMN